MIKITIELDATDIDTNEDICLYKTCLNEDYSGDKLLKYVNDAITHGEENCKNKELAQLSPILHINIFAENESGFRPAFYLDVKTIKRIAQHKIALDFDPYIYS